MVKRIIIVILYLSGILPSTFLLAQNGTEIFLLDLTSSKSDFKASNPVNISHRKGYDNQPCFSEKQALIYYSAFYDSIQSDIYGYDYESRITKQITHNTESEYSPQIMPDKKHFSVVKGKEQNLTAMLLDGSEAKIIATHKDSIGYYRWLNKNELAAFILTQPHSLQWMNIKTGENKIVMKHPGRSIFKYKDGILVTNKENPDSAVISFVTRFGDRLDWIKLPPGTEDFFLTEDNLIFTSEKGKILYSLLNSPDDEWKELIDLSSAGIDKITRIAINKKQNKIAIVVPE